MPVTHVEGWALDEHQIKSFFRHVYGRFIYAVAYGARDFTLLPNARRQKDEHAHVFQCPSANPTGRIRQFEPDLVILRRNQRRLAVQVFDPQCRLLFLCNCGIQFGGEDTRAEINAVDLRRHPYCLFRFPFAH